MPGITRPTAICWLVLAALCGPLALPGDEPSPDVDASFRTRTVRGKVVWMADALARQYGVLTVPEARERILALETSTGELYPLVEDLRGRAFRKDARLRDLPVEILARQHAGSPMLQVIKLFEVRDGKLLVIDYWCEICAIAMYELKACDCCQGPIELRTRPVD